MNAVGVLAAPGVSQSTLVARLRAQLPPGLTVLDRGHAAAADAGDPRAAQRADAIGFLATMGAFAGIVAVFVVGSTFAFAVAQRRREIALMRLVGATAGQVRRMIAGEALAAAIIGGAIGCAAGLPLAVPIARALVRAGVAPDGFHASISWIPLLAAFGTGLLVCEIAVAAAAWRAGRVRPAESLREALLEPRGLGPVRWLLGLLAVGGAAALIVTVPVGGALAAPAALLAGIGVALLAPLVLGFPAAALSYPLRTVGGAPGLLASTAITANRRRAGAIAAPIALVVALAGTQAIIDATTRATLQETTAERVHAPYVLVARAGDGLPASTVQLARKLPGVTAAAGIMPTTVFLLDPGLDNYGSGWPAAGLDPATAPGGLDLDVLAGSLASLHGDTIAVSSELAAHRNLQVGAILTARLADLTWRQLRVGAIFRHALGLGDVILPMPLAQAHAAVKLDSAIFVTGPPAIRAELGAMTAAVPTAAVLSRAQYLSTVQAAAQASAWPAWLLIGLIIAFAALSMVNTAVMATAGRQRELTLARLTGATSRQARQRHHLGSPHHHPDRSRSRRGHRPARRTHPRHRARLAPHRPARPVRRDPHRRRGAGHDRQPPSRPAPPPVPHQDTARSRRMNTPKARCPRRQVLIAGKMLNLRPCQPGPPPGLATPIAHRPRHADPPAAGSPRVPSHSPSPAPVPPPAGQPRAGRRPPLTARRPMADRVVSKPASHRGWLVRWPGSADQPQQPDGPGRPHVNVLHPVVGDTGQVGPGVVPQRRLEPAQEHPAQHVGNRAQQLTRHSMPS